VALGTLCGDGEPVDEVLLSCAQEGRYELGCHSGPALLEHVLQTLEQAGAERRAESSPAGLDPLQAEAWSALPQASTELGAQVLLAQAHGALSLAVSQAGTDPARLEALLGTARAGRALLEPPRLALIGRPNAGKSNLMNALLDRQRVIVDAEAGTTRDAVAERAELHGLPVEWVDTAGQRETADPLEAAGVAKAKRAAEEAECRLVVLDATELSDETLARARAVPAPRLVTLNKRDLLDPHQLEAALERTRDLRPVPVSALTHAGLDELRRALRDLLGGEASLAGPVVFNARQEAWLRAARDAAADGAPDRCRACLQGLVSGAAFTHP